MNELWFFVKAETKSWPNVPTLPCFPSKCPAKFLKMHKKCGIGKVDGALISICWFMVCHFCRSVRFPDNDFPIYWQK